jgi:hypothetical protein
MDLRRFSRCQTQQLLSATAVSAGLLLCFGQGLHAERAQERLDQAETLQASLRQQAEARAELLAVSKP